MPSMEVTLNLLISVPLQSKPAASVEEGAQPHRPRPPTHRRPILLLRIHVTPAPVRTEVSAAAQDQDTLASVLELASPATIVRQMLTIARRRVVPMVVLVSMESMASYANVPVRASPATPVRQISTIAHRRVVPMVVLVSMESMASHATVLVLVLRVLLVKLNHRQRLLLPTLRQQIRHRQIRRLRINQGRREPSSRHGGMYLTTMEPIG